jgi:hypothetical protein
LNDTFPAGNAESSLQSRIAVVGKDGLPRRLQHMRPESALVPVPAGNR